MMRDVGAELLRSHITEFRVCNKKKFDILVVNPQYLVAERPLVQDIGWRL
jgi:hypothetical protein